MRLMTAIAVLVLFGSIGAGIVWEEKIIDAKVRIDNDIENGFINLSRFQLTTKDFYIW